MLKDEKGYIVIETLLAFLLYFLAMLSILTLVNIAVVQSRIHYAISEACQSASMYSYILEVTGQAAPMMNRATTSEKTEEQINEIVSNINGIVDGVMSLDSNSVRQKADNIKTTADQMTWKQLLTTFAKKAENVAFALCMSSLSTRYLNQYGKSGEVLVSGDDYLKVHGVEDGLNLIGTYGLGMTGLELSLDIGADGSSLLDSNGDITVAVSYEIDYRFGGLQLPFKKLRTRQVVKTKAWLGGYGEGYQK